MRGISFRRGLVVFQFCIAQVMFICVLVMVSHMNYFRNRPLGFEKKSIVNVPIPNDSLSRLKWKLWVTCFCSNRESAM